MIHAMFALPGCRHPKKYLTDLTRTGSVKQCTACGAFIADNEAVFKRWARKQ